MNKRIIIGNWKMNPRTTKDAEKLFSSVAKSVSRTKKTDIVICAPYVYLEKLTKIRTNKIKIGSQDAFWGDVGPFTGQVSAEMLHNLGVRYTILGHSERRALGETDSNINKKIKECLSAGIRPILCVGENTRDESHGYFNLVKTQLQECLAGISKDSITKIIIAYEPVWALSSTPGRRDATRKDSEEMAIFIRKVLSDKFGAQVSKVRVIYGGSANSKDAGDFLQYGGVDGLLPGKASLSSKEFSEIIKIAESI